MAENKENKNEQNPERYQDANLGQGGGSRGEQNQHSTSRESSEEERTSEEKTSGGSAFNERHQSTAGYGSSQRADRENIGPLDADLNDLPSERRSGSNQTGPGLG